VKVIVASSDLGLSLEIIGEVAAMFATAPPGEAFGIRVPFDESEPASQVERLVESVAARLNRSVIRFSPTKGGRSAVFHRDYDLVDDATEVLAFFSTEREMDGGTGHVVKAALDRGVKVDAYTSRPDGTLAYLGSSDEAMGRRPQSTPNRVLRQMYEEAQEA
jgi:hypothetical protein